MKFACHVVISLTGVGRVEITGDLLSRCFGYIRMVIYLLFASINPKHQES